MTGRDDRMPALVHRPAALLARSSFVRFFLGSVSALGLDYLLYLGLAHWIAPEVANVVSSSTAMLYNFVLHRWVVFPGSRRELWRSFVISMSLSGVGVLLSTSIIFVLRLAFPAAVLAPKVIATGVVFFWNFLSKRYLAFPAQAELPAGPEPGP